jgi:hypothetical protein
MKRIKQEEARQYVLASDIYEAKYFFTAPSTDPEYPAKEGWEDVKYFSRKNTVITQSGEGDTYVYILSNTSIPGQFKIGYTTETPEQRAKQLSSGTNTPTSFQVEWYFKCFRGDLLEQEVHQHLHEYRTSDNREFFRVSFDYAKQVIENLGSRYLSNL